MPTDEELIQRLRAELGALQPPGDLVERLRQDGAAEARGGVRALLRSRGGRRPRRRPTAGFVAVAASTMLTLGIAAGALVLLGHRGPSPAAVTSTTRPTRKSPPLAARRDRLVLTGASLGTIRFGASPARLQQLLVPLLGRPPGGYEATSDCHVDHVLLWPILLDPATGHAVRSEELELFFHGGRFVGYQYGGFVLAKRGGGRRLLLRATTTRGLALGDSLAAGRLIYGRAFRTSSAQGGTWQADTPQGTIRGYAFDYPDQGRVSATSLIASIDAGDVGCPSQSP